MLTLTVLINQKLYKSDLISFKMVEMDLNRKNIFIVKVRGKENSKTVQIPDSVCEFCDINIGELIKLEILEKKSSKKEVKKK